MEILGTILIGLLVGIVAKLLMPVFDQTVEEPRQFMGHCGDALSWPKPCDHSSIECAQSGLAALESRCRHPQHISHSIDDSPGATA